MAVLSRPSGILQRTTDGGKRHIVLELIAEERRHLGPIGGRILGEILDQDILFVRRHLLVTSDVVRTADTWL
ncbi:hypothetical protein BFJ68_g17330 [Fusarium oxysporum]|uniref:Uncharacterized protein n=1 Tax=Fusarium oxysporum TaxID=5507 RepID=A0A420NX28_FUSOX|nr:hypothetical protein BFJ68_g17330 [Fusarium oxysporum]